VLLWEEGSVDDRTESVIFGSKKMKGQQGRIWIRCGQDRV